MAGLEYHVPGLYLLHSRIAPPGMPPAADGDDSRAAHKKIVYAVTPSTAGTTYDFWCMARDQVGDVEADTRGMKSQTAVLTQDVDALNLLEVTLAGEPSGYQELSVNIDTGALAARRMLAAMAEAGERGVRGMTAPVAQVRAPEGYDTFSITRVPGADVMLGGVLLRREARRRGPGRAVRVAAWPPPRP